MSKQLDAIETLMEMNRTTARTLTNVLETNTADYAYISEALALLNEQFHILLQQKEEMQSGRIVFSEDEELADKRMVLKQEEGSEMSGTACRTDDNVAAERDKKRGRGAVKKHYLKDDALKPSFLSSVRHIFLEYYAGGKMFRLPNGGEAKAPSLLACLYDIGIKRGLTSAEAPMRDFSDMVAAVARECPNASDFDTAYNTIQKAIKEWNPLTGQVAEQLYCTNARLHRIDPSDVPTDFKKRYVAWMKLYGQVEKMLDESDQTKAQ